MLKLPDKSEGGNSEMVEQTTEYELEVESLYGEEMLPAGRYLLYDSGCDSCEQIAQEVKSVAGNWLEVRSLHETVVADTLNRQNQDWSWEPTLLEISENSEETNILTGHSMRTKFIVELGPVKALKIWAIVRKLSEKNRSTSIQIKLSPLKDNPHEQVVESVKTLSRRDLLRIGVSGVAATLLASVPGLTGLADRAEAKRIRSGLIVQNLSSSAARKQYRTLAKAGSIAPVGRHLRRRGFKLIAGSFRGTRVTGNGKVITHIRARFRKGSVVANLMFEQFVGNGKVRRRAFYNVGINRNKGVEVWGLKRRRMTRLNRWNNWRAEYRRVMGENPPSQRSSSSANTRSAQAYDSCDLCQSLVGYIFKKTCIASLSPGAIVIAAVVCGTNPYCLGAAAVTLTVFVEIGCTVLNDASEAGRVVCTYDLKAC